MPPQLFPSLQPALVMKLHLNGFHKIGQLANGSNLIHFEANTGSIESVEGFEPKISAKVVMASDWLRFDADGKHARLDFRGVAVTDEEEGINFAYQGTIRISDDLRKILEMDPNAQSVPFGLNEAVHHLQSGAERLGFLENTTFVSNARMLVDEQTKAITVENRISRVVSATGAD
ncbi:hypothetical protein PG984_012233 [Apiospora sp. TS-2023a]